MITLPTSSVNVRHIRKKKMTIKCRPLSVGVENQLPSNGTFPLNSSTPGAKSVMTTKDRQKLGY